MAIWKAFTYLLPPVLFWIYRIIKLGNIAFFGIFYDFNLYIEGVQKLLFSKDLYLAGQTSYGPPFTLIPFIPFSFVPQIISGIIFTVINLIAFFIAYKLFWKKEVGKTNRLYYLITALFAFSFPLIFSLGMGNPAGLVTLGIYLFLLYPKNNLANLFFQIAILLKVFPIVILPSIINKGVNRKIIIKKLLISFCISVILSLVFIPKESWLGYKDKFLFLKTAVKTTFDNSSYNQSFVTTSNRLGLPNYQFSGSHFIFIFLLTIYFLYKKHYHNPFKSLAFILLIHPFAWQHYFTVFLPFLATRLGKKDYKYLFPFILISFDGGRLIPSNIFTALLTSSQFLGSFLILLFDKKER